MRFKALILDRKPWQRITDPRSWNDKLYEELREEGESTHLGDRGKDKLYDKAQEIGIEGRLDMAKDELIDAIRSH